MDDSSLGLSSFQPDSLKLWLHLTRFRFGIIYEQRVARIYHDYRICEQQADRTSMGDNKISSIENKTQFLRKRGDLFLERCRQEWLSFHILGTLLSGAIMILMADRDVRNNAIIRTSALLSLEFALATAAYGIVYFLKMGSITARLRIELISSMCEYRHVWDAFALPVTYLTWSTIFLALTFIMFIWTSGPSSSIPARDTPLPLWSFILVIAGIFHPIYRSFEVIKTVGSLFQPVETPAADKE